MINFWKILVSTVLLVKVVHGIDISICPGLTQSQYSYPGDCTKYVQCNNGEATIVNCESASNFNPQTHKCDSSDETSVCDNPSHGQEILQIICKNVHPSNLLPHPFDCSKFITCNPTLSVIQNCPPGLVFDLESMVCNYPSSVPGCVDNYGHGNEHRKDVKIVAFNSGEVHQNTLEDDESNGENQVNSLDPVQRDARSAIYEGDEEEDESEVCEDDDS